MSYDTLKIGGNKTTTSDHICPSHSLYVDLPPSCLLPVTLDTPPDVYEPRKGDREKAKQGRSSKLAQRIVRSRSGEKGENWMYWWEQERFRGQETQISRKKGLVLLPGKQLVESRVTRTSGRGNVGSAPPWYARMEQLACHGCSYTWAAEPRGRGVHCSPCPGATPCSHIPPQPPLSQNHLLDSVCPSRQWRQPHFLCRAAVKMN